MWLGCKKFISSHRPECSIEWWCDADYHHEVAPLPFELQVLEAALKDVTQLANQLTMELEAVAHPALDALTKTVRPYRDMPTRFEQSPKVTRPCCKLKKRGRKKKFIFKP
jgi:hypothetical protein